MADKQTLELIEQHRQLIAETRAMLADPAAHLRKQGIDPEAWDKLRQQPPSAASRAMADAKVKQIMEEVENQVVQAVQPEIKARRVVGKRTRNLI